MEFLPRGFMAEKGDLRPRSRQSDHKVTVVAVDGQKKREYKQEKAQGGRESAPLNNPKMIYVIKLTFKWFEKSL